MGSFGGSQRHSRGRIQQLRQLWVRVHNGVAPLVHACWFAVWMKQSGWGTWRRSRISSTPRSLLSQHISLKCSSGWNKSWMLKLMIKRQGYHSLSSAIYNFCNLCRFYWKNLKNSHSKGFQMSVAALPRMLTSWKKWWAGKSIVLYFIFHPRARRNTRLRSMSSDRSNRSSFTNSSLSFRISKLTLMKSVWLWEYFSYFTSLFHRQERLIYRLARSSKNNLWSLISWKGNLICKMWST